MDCSTMEKLISAIIRTWYHDEEIAKICSTLVDSMPNRVALVIKERGGHTKYLLSLCIFVFFKINMYYVSNSYFLTIFSTVRINLHTTV